MPRKDTHRRIKAETEIRELKAWKTCMTERQVPKRLWDYGFVYISEIL
jgi:hypothetical protein